MRVKQGVFDYDMDHQAHYRTAAENVEMQMQNRAQWVEELIDSDANQLGVEGQQPATVENDPRRQAK